MRPAEEAKAIGTPEYWDVRYAQSDGQNPTHEWVKTFEALEPFLKERLYPVKPAESNPRVLHLGSGDSTLPADFAAQGYTNQLCVDFSHTVVNLMRERHAPAGIEWAWADIRDMNELKADTIDVAFDKCALDAMIHGSPWSPPDEVVSDTSRYIREVHRILKPDGIFFCISFRQPHFIKPLLQAGDEGLWDLEVVTLPGGPGSFENYGFIMQRK